MSPAVRRRRLGILIKNVADIELAAKITRSSSQDRHVTTGQLAVSRLMPIGETKPPNCCASPPLPKNTATIRLRRRSQTRGEAGVPLAEPKDFAETAGRGVKAHIDDAAVLVRPRAWLKDNGVAANFESPLTSTKPRAGV